MFLLVLLPRCGGSWFDLAISLDFEDKTGLFDWFITIACLCLVNCSRTVCPLKKKKKSDPGILPDPRKCWVNQLQKHLVCPVSTASVLLLWFLSKISKYPGESTIFISLARTLFCYCFSYTPMLFSLSLPLQLTRLNNCLWRTRLRI